MGCGVQSHYIEVVHGDILIEKLWYLSWFWAGWKYWKKMGANYEQLLWAVFRGKKNIKNIVASALKSCTIYIFYFLNFFLAKNRLNIHNQLCIALLESLQWRHLPAWLLSNDFGDIHSYLHLRRVSFTGI